MRSVGIHTVDGPKLVNLILWQIGNTSEMQIPAVKAAVESGDCDFYFGPFSSVRIL